MVASNVSMLIPPSPPPKGAVVLVDPDERASLLLRVYLESHGWEVTGFADARSAVRRWGDTLVAPLVVLKLDDDDPDGFELLAALQSKAPLVRVVVCVPPSLAGEIWTGMSLGIERVLPASCRFSELAEVLESLREAPLMTEEAS